MADVIARMMSYGGPEIWGALAYSSGVGKSFPGTEGYYLYLAIGDAEKIKPFNDLSLNKNFPAFELDEAEVFLASLLEAVRAAKKFPNLAP